MAAISAAALIGCADQIEVPDDNNGAGGSGRIVYNEIFRLDEESDATIKIIDSNGSLVRNMGTGLLGGTGSGKIAYAEYAQNTVYGISDIYTANSDGTGARLTASVMRAGQSIYWFPTISSNGQVVAFATKDSISPTLDERVLHIVKHDGTGHQEISHQLAYETNYALSPDGSKIAYFRSEIGAGSTAPADLMVGRTDGTGSVMIASGLTPRHDFAAGISWSPNGDKIAFNVHNGSGYDVYVINADGSGMNNIGKGMWPAWSPDGLALAWMGVAQDQTNAEIVYTTDMGITIQTLTNTAEAESEIQFSPDGKKILCTIWSEDVRESNGKLKLIDIATKQSTIIAETAHTGFWVK